LYVNYLFLRYVTLRVFTSAPEHQSSQQICTDNICFWDTPNIWRILSLNSGCSINNLMSKHSFWSTTRLFLYPLQSMRLFSFMAVWYIPLCQIKCLKHCWCLRQMPTCVP